MFGCLGHSCVWLFVRDWKRASTSSIRLLRRLGSGVPTTLITRCGNWDTQPQYSGVGCAWCHTIAGPWVPMASASRRKDTR